MIYLDSAATSLQKPRAVYQAVQKAMQSAGGYGRSGHRPALYAGELVYACRENARRLFGLQEPEQVVFTMNATHALNQAIHALADVKTRAAITGYEHNSVVRPLVERGIPYQVLESRLFDSNGMLQAARQALEDGANLFVINHVSNVFGSIAPIAELDAMLADAGVPMILDASQSAGTLEIHADKLRSAAAICMPGHKGLLGPQGTGMLLVCSEKLQKPLMQGGTGSLSQDMTQPKLLPDRFESGTPNVPGIAGLDAGLRFLLARGLSRIRKHEQMLAADLTDGLSTIDGVEVFYHADPARQAGVVSFRHAKMPCEILAEKLADRDVCVRAGLHCAPLAHRSAGTLASGTVRVSFGPFNTRREVREFTGKLCEILEKL